MRFPPTIHLQASHLPVSSRTADSRQSPTNQSVAKPPRKPDWVLIMVGLLMLLTLVIAWLVDIP